MMDRFGLVCLLFCSVFFIQCRCDDYPDEYDDYPMVIINEEVVTEQTESSEIPEDTLVVGTEYEENDNTLFSNLFPTEATTVQNSSENEVEHELSENTEDIVKKPQNPEISLLIENLTSTVSNLTKELLKQKSQIADLEKTNKRLEDKIEFIEQQTKTNSLIFFNVPETEHETHKTTLNRVLYVMNKVMKVKTRADEIAAALRADSGDGASYRPIMVRFVNFETKMRVLGAKPRLQQSRITVEQDYSEGVARERALLVPYMMAARAQGGHAYILYNRLVVNGVRLSLQELRAQELPRPTQQILSSTIMPR